VDPGFSERGLGEGGVCTRGKADVLPGPRELELNSGGKFFQLV